MNFLFDIKYALRLLSQNLSFTLLIIIVLAGGLGLVIFTYSFMDGLINKGLPFENGKSIVRIYSKYQNNRGLMDAVDFNRIRSKITTLENIGTYKSRRVVISNSEGQNGKQIFANYADWNIFELSNTRPILGRGFVPEDELIGAEAVMVISHKVWRNDFAQRNDIVGFHINVNGVLTRIVGVMPEGYAFPLADRAWLPLIEERGDTLSYDEQYVSTYAKIKANVSYDQVNAELDTLMKQLRSEDPDSIIEDLADSAYIVDFAKAQMGDEQESMLIFGIINFAAISILILACINVGNLLLSKTNERIKEVSIRMALGAPRGRLIIQMMWESVLICMFGGFTGLLLAGWGLDFITQWYDINLGNNIPFWWKWRLSLDSVVVAVFFSAFAVLLTGCVTAWHASKCNFNTLLNDGTHGSVGMSAGKLSNILVVIEVIIISVLLYLGMVTVMVCVKLADLASDLAVKDTLIASMALPKDQYNERNKVLNYYTQLNLGLVQGNSINSVLTEKSLGEVSYAVENVEYQSKHDYPTSMAKSILGSLNISGVSLIAGRDFNQSDTLEGVKSAMVSRSFAEKYWPNASVLGKRVRIITTENDSEWRTIIGVVSDIEANLLISNDTSAFTIYVPMRQLPDELLIGQDYNVIFKHNGAASQARSDFYYVFNQIDPQVFINRVMDLADNFKLMNISAVFSAKLMLQFALFAMLIAICGIYGLTQNSILQSTREIGVRRALGATDRWVIYFFLLKGSKQLLIGLSIGFVIAATLTLVVSQVLIINVVIYIASIFLVIVAISVIVLLAIYIPITQAIKPEPSVALHYE